MFLTLSRFAAAAAIAVGASGAQANVVFSDNFDANSPGLNAAPAGWTVSDGTVDIIGNGFNELVPGNGLYIDLDGSSFDAGKMSIQLNLTGGLLHTLSFDLAGNRRNGRVDQVDVTFGSAMGSYSLGQSAGFTPFSLTFTPAATGSYTLSFEDLGADNQGMLLDRVKVVAVPEPQTYALLALGLLALGAGARRRRA